MALEWCTADLWTNGECWLCADLVHDKIGSRTGGETVSNYRIVIQYDGTRYRGWQSLSGTDATIQGKLETVLSQMTGKRLQ